MPGFRVCIGIAGAAVLATACWLVVAGELRLAALSGGSFTVQDQSEQAYSAPGPTLSAEQLQQFANGRSEFHQRWVVPVVIGGNWGRGPTSNGEVCTDCHAGNGRGRPPEHEDDESVSMLVRLSLPGEDEHGGPRPHPHYGDQLQQQGVLGKVPPEGRVEVAWREHEVELAGGDTMRLRFPVRAPQPARLRAARNRYPDFAPSGPACVRHGSARGDPGGNPDRNRAPAGRVGLQRASELRVGRRETGAGAGALRLESRAAHAQTADRRRIPERHGRHDAGVLASQLPAGAKGLQQQSGSRRSGADRPCRSSR